MSDEKKVKDKVLKKFFRWLFFAECEDFLWSVYSKDLYRRLDYIEESYRTMKELVMQRKLQELGYDVKNVFPRPHFTSDGEIPLEELPKHPTGWFEVVNSKTTPHRGQERK